MPPRLLASLAVVSLLVGPPSHAGGKGAAAADANAGVTVEGEISVPAAGVREPAAQYIGFIDRIPNPITGLRPFDPRPESFVYLDGGPGGADASKVEANKTITWNLQSETFTPPIMPVLIGMPITIKNVGKNTQPLTADTASVFSGTDAIGPGGVRPLAIKETGKAIIIRSTDSPHLEGRVVALPTKYFAAIKRDGTFKIEDVPAGKYTLRVWYRDGWLTSADKPIEVTAKMEKVKIALPEKLEPPAAGDKPAQK